MKIVPFFTEESRSETIWKKKKKSSKGSDGNFELLKALFLTKANKISEWF